MASTGDDELVTVAELLTEMTQPKSNKFFFYINRYRNYTSVIVMHIWTYQVSKINLLQHWEVPVHLHQITTNIKTNSFGILIRSIQEFIQR